MPTYLYAWRAVDGTFLLRAVVGPVSEARAREVDRVVPEDQADDVLAEAEEICALPFCVTGRLEAPDWDEAARRVQAWHFT